MQGIEQAYCNVCINAVIWAWRSLLEATAVEILGKSKYGKGDTLGLDAIPEICIGNKIRAFDNHALLVTEEEGKRSGLKERWPTDSNPERQPLMFFSDPTDRSKQFAKYIESLAKENPLEKVGVLLGNIDPVKVWEEMFEGPAAITGATTSITCVRKGMIIFSVILNYISSVIYVAAPSGIFVLDLPPYLDSGLENINFDHIVSQGKRLEFQGVAKYCSNCDAAKRFATFLGKSGYKENFSDSKLFLEDPSAFLHHTEPGGPSRVLYLSEIQQKNGPVVGFILANGEKIGEWIHWLAFARFAKNRQGQNALTVFEISIERPWTKDGVLMSTSSPYSIFCIDAQGNTYLDISRLRHFDNPSKFRSMLVVMPYDNDPMIYKMVGNKHRQIIL